MSTLIKIKLLELHKTQVDLMLELRKRNFSIDPSQLSRYINEIEEGPKARLIIEEIHKILKEWEE